MFKKLKHIQTYFNISIPSETTAQRKFLPYLGFVDKKITNLSCSLSFNQAAIINPLNNKSRNIAQKEIKIENRNYSFFFLKVFLFYKIK